MYLTVRARILSKNSELVQLIPNFKYFMVVRSQYSGHSTKFKPHIIIMEEENVGKALEDSMNRLKCNSDIWDAICDTKEEEDVLVRKDGRKNNSFKERRSLPFCLSMVYQW